MRLGLRNVFGDEYELFNKCPVLILLCALESEDLDRKVTKEKSPSGGFYVRLVTAVTRRRVQNYWLVLGRPGR